MINSFSCKATEALFDSTSVPRFKNIERVARRKLLQLHAATKLDSLRINEQWRICFLWRDGAADQVEIVDYH